MGNMETAILTFVCPLMCAIYYGCVISEKKTNFSIRRAIVKPLSCPLGDAGQSCSSTVCATSC